MAKLSKEHIVTIEVLKAQGQSNCRIAQLLRVTEGAVRYHVRRRAEKAADGRKRPMRLEQLGLDEAVTQWWTAEQARLRDERPPNVEALHAWLQSEHNYDGSYKSVVKFVRRRFPAPKRRPFRRIETPPGVQAQTDWMELRGVDIGDPSGPVTLYGFVMTLSHSRYEAIIWSRSMNQLAWHRCHNEAFRRLGGVPAVNRIDNLRTGIAKGAGPWSEVNAQYRVYAKAMGFHVDACEVRCPEQKGKAERRVGVFKRIDPRRMCFDSIEHLQEWTDARIESAAQRRICPPTGTTVQEAWQAERTKLRPLPETLPEPFDVVVTRPVYKDCTVQFEGRTYAVPFEYSDRQVEVRGCAGTVQIVDCMTGRVVQSYPRGTPERILIDPSCYEGESTDRVAAPKPLGRMTKAISKLASTAVEMRSIDWYAQLAEVAR